MFANIQILYNKLYKRINRMVIFTRHTILPTEISNRYDGLLFINVHATTLCR